MADPAVPAHAGYAAYLRWIVVLGLIQAYTEGFWDARWTTTVIFSVLIAILVFRPSGLLGEQVPEGQ